MSLLNFPSSPNPGDKWTVGLKIYQWNGSAWIVFSSSIVAAALTSDTIVAASTANSTSTVTGAVIVSGGIGVGADVYIGGNITVVGTINGVSLQGGTSINTTNTDASYYVTFVSTSTGTLSNIEVDPVGLTYNPSTQQLTAAGVIHAASIQDTPIGTTTPRAGKFTTLQADSTSTITDNTSATSTSTGALTIVGGVGIGGDLYVAGIIVGTLTTATNLAGGTTGQVPYQVSPGTTSFYGPGTAGDVLVSKGNAAPQYQNTLTLAGNTQSTSTTTGALVINGGVGIGGDLYVGGQFFAGGGLVLTTASFNNTPSDGSDIHIVKLGGGILQFNDISTLQTVTSRGNTTNQIIKITNTTESTSATIGAMVISGGLGVAKRINCESIKIADTVFDSTEVALNTLATAVIDSYSVIDFRTAKYLVQIESGTGLFAKFQAVEILLLANNTGSVFATEYGLVTTDGELGTFTADLQVDNIVRLYFTPYDITNKIIYVLRTSMAA